MHQMRLFIFVCSCGQCLDTKHLAKENQLLEAIKYIKCCIKYKLSNTLVYVHREKSKKDTSETTSGEKYTEGLGEIVNEAERVRGIIT